MLSHLQYLNNLDSPGPPPPSPTPAPAPSKTVGKQKGTWAFSQPVAPIWVVYKNYYLETVLEEECEPLTIEDLLEDYVPPPEERLDLVAVGASPSASDEGMTVADLHAQMLEAEARQKRTTVVIGAAIGLLFLLTLRRWPRR